MALDWTKLNLIFRKANKRYPSVPTIDNSIESHTAALKQMKEAHEIAERRSGDIRDSFVRVGELEGILGSLYPSQGVTSTIDSSDAWPGFATRAETDAGVIDTKALNPDVGAYAYDRLRHGGQHEAGKGTTTVELVPVAGNVTVDCTLSNVFVLSMTADVTIMNNPVNPYHGQVINIKWVQGVGAPWSVVAWGDQWKFVNRALPVFSTTEGNLDLLSCQWDEDLQYWLCAWQRDYGADGLGSDLLFDVSNVGAGAQVYKETADVLGTTTAYLRSITASFPLTVTQGTDTLDFALPTLLIEDLDETNIPYKSPGDVLTWDGYNWIADAPAAGGATALDSLTDVRAPSPSAGDVLTWDGYEWFNNPLQLDELHDVRAPSPAAGDFLQWNGYEWANHPILTGSVTVDKTSGLQFEQGWPLYIDGTPAVDLTYDSSTKKVTITAKGGASTFTVYWKGVAHTEASPFVSTAHSADQGNHFYYWDGGNWVWSDTAWDIMTTAPTALIYWDTTSSTGVLFKETHTTSRDPAIHRRLHEIEGTALVSGGVLSGYTLDTDTDAGVSFAVSAAIIADEDLHTTTAVQTDAGTYYIWYRTGAAGDWTYTTQAGYPWTKGTNYPKINTYVASSWGLNELSNGDYATFYVLATPAITTGHGVVIIPGQTRHSTQAAADAETFSSLSRGSDSMPFQEFVVLAKVVIQTGNAFGGTTKSKIKTVTAYSGTRTASIASSSATNHNALSGLQGGTAGEYYHLTAAQIAALGGGGAVGTDVIWDAKGDLAGGTGADTAARLAVGANGAVLVADSAEATGLKWDATVKRQTLGATWGNSTALTAPAANVDVLVPRACTIKGVRIFTTGGNGSCAVDIWKDTYANFPPTVADTIVAAAKPTIAAAAAYSDDTLTGWTVALAAGDVIRFNLDSTSTFTRISVFLIVE